MTGAVLRTGFALAWRRAGMALAALAMAVQMGAGAWVPDVGAVAARARLEGALAASICRGGEPARPAPKQDHSSHHDCALCLACEAAALAALLPMPASPALPVRAAAMRVAPGWVLAAAAPVGARAAFRARAPPPLG